MPSRILLASVALVALGWLCGCQHPFNHDNFERITVGTDDKTDVQYTLGKPTSQLADKWLYDDLKRHYSAIIHFDTDGRVAGKEWIDSKQGLWEGQNPDADEPPQGEVREVHRKTTRIDKH
jgi:hypothetical protein